LKDVNTRRVGHLEKQDIYYKTRNMCILTESCGEVFFDCESQMCATKETEYFITFRLNFLIQPFCMRPRFQWLTSVWLLWTQ